MKAEIIAVGTEILLGQIVNSNASVLAKELAALGIDSTNQQVVGDNPGRLEEALTLAASRADIIISIGGLGPTKDDLSKQVMAKHIGEPLVVNQPALAHLAEWAAQREQAMTPNNRVQAMLPFTAQPLTNTVGLAVGAVNLVGHKIYILLPGPPREFTPMVHDQLVPYLSQLIGHDGVMVSRVMRFFGIGESLLVTKLADLIDTQTNPTIAPYIKDYEVTLRLTAKAADEAAAQALIAPLAGEVLTRVGDYYYGDGDHNSLETVLVNELAAKRQTITAAESLTAGAFQATLADVPGVSEWFKGGFVTYSNHTKAAFLGLAEDHVDAVGAVSEDTAKAMAAGALHRAEADIALSFTGVAGPGPNEGQPAGTVWIGVAQRGGGVTAQVFHFPGSRHDVRYRAVKTGLFLALRTLQNS